MRRSYRGTQKSTSARFEGGAGTPQGAMNAKAPHTQESWGAVIGKQVREPKRVGDLAEEKLCSRKSSINYHRAEALKKTQ